MDNLAKDMVQEDLIPKEDLDKYKQLIDSIKTDTAEKELINKRIKAKLGDFAIDALKRVIEPHSDLVDSYLDAVAALSVARISGTGVTEAADHLKAVYAELQLMGISKAMITDYVSGDRTSALAHNKVSLQLFGYKVATTTQDKSAVNQDKAIAFIKKLGLDNLLVQKVVVDEAGLELAILNGEIDAEEFKDYCIDEKLVVALTVK